MHGTAGYLGYPLRTSGGCVQFTTETELPTTEWLKLDNTAPQRKRGMGRRKSPQRCIAESFSAHTATVVRWDPMLILPNAEAPTLVKASAVHVAKETRGGSTTLSCYAQTKYIPQYTPPVSS